MSDWNKPKQPQRGSGASPLGSRPKHPLLKGLVAGAAVVLVALGVAYWLWVPGKEDDGRDPTRSRLIKEVKPSIPKTATNETDAAVAEKEAKTSTTNAPLGKQKVGEVRNGYVLLPDGTLHRRLGLKKMPEGPEPDRGHWSQVFDTKTDNEIAAVLTVKPGDMILGGMGGRKAFVRSFKESLKVPIITKADDSEEVKNLKQAVKDARLELVDAMNRGEDIAQIMADAYEQSERLARYKSELESEVKRIVKDGDYSNEEVDTLVAGANKMLAEKGIGPMRVNSVSRLRVQLLKKQMQREQEFQQQQENYEGDEQ